ncbi:hypothetical protein Tco_0130565 [Tanacetum coccineum]
MQEEIALCKGWLAVSENSKQGNSRKFSGFWCEVLSYIESKIGQYGKRTYDMVIGKWKTVRPAVVRFCGVYNNIMHIGPEIGAGDEDYILKDHLKWQEIAIPTFNTEGSSKRHKSTGSSSFNTESGEASINLIILMLATTMKMRCRKLSDYKAGTKRKVLRKRKGSKSSASASSNVNEDAWLG